MESGLGGGGPRALALEVALLAGVLVGLGLLAFGVYETDWLPAALGVATVTVSARLLLKPHPG